MLRFTPGQIEDIRRRYASGEPQQSIASIYGVSKGAIAYQVRDTRGNAAKRRLRLVDVDTTRELGNWREQAACAGYDTNAWFPGYEDWGAIRLAIRICDGCPVRTECLTYALQTGSVGIFGGHYLGAKAASARRAKQKRADAEEAS